jgi:hypothetical protein
MLVALVALFVALGGPAQASRLARATVLAKGSVTSRQVRDHSLEVRDLRKGAVRTLERTPNGSITEAKIRNGSITPGKLARSSVDSTAIADRSVASGDIALGAVGSLEVRDGSLTGTDVADGSLDAREIARYWGHFTAPMPAILAHTCWEGDPVGLAPERNKADISGDALTVTPVPGWPADLTLMARPSTTPSRFTLQACNQTGSPIPAASRTFNYLVINVP